MIKGNPALSQRASRVCAKTGSSEPLGARDEGLNLSPSDLLEEGPHFILVALAASIVPRRYMGDESLVTHIGHLRRCGRTPAKPGASR